MQARSSAVFFPAIARSRAAAQRERAASATLHGVPSARYEVPPVVCSAPSTMVLRDVCLPQASASARKTAAVLQLRRAHGSSLRSPAMFSSSRSKSGPYWSGPVLALLSSVHVGILVCCTAALASSRKRARHETHHACTTISWTSARTRTRGPPVLRTLKLTTHGKTRATSDLRLITGSSVGKPPSQARALL